MNSVNIAVDAMYDASKRSRRSINVQSLNGKTFSHPHLSNNGTVISSKDQVVLPSYQSLRRKIVVYNPSSARSEEWSRAKVGFPLAGIKVFKVLATSCPGAVEQAAPLLFFSQ